MKLTIKILLIIVILGGGALWYWQYHKKSIIKNLIQDTISVKTDSLYYVRYDSSMIDEVNGNVYFRNVFLQSDSAQQVILQSEDSLPNAIYNIHIKTLSATGVDMQKAIQENKLHAKKIIIDRPLIQIINTGSKIFKIEDTIALYKKMVGEFKSIHADSILIQNGTIIIRNRMNEKLAELSNANIKLAHFKVDSTRDYSNILSYFIDNLEASVDKISVTRNQKKGIIELNEVNYNSVKKTLLINQIVSFTENKKVPSTQLNQVKLDKLNVNAFVHQHRLQAGILSCAGGIITVYTNKKDSSAKKLNNKSFEFPEDFFDEVEIGSVSLGNTTLLIRDKQSPKDDPIKLRDVTFNVSNETNMLEGNTFRNIINKANWKLTTSGFSIPTKDNLYDLSIEGVAIDRQASSVRIAKFKMKPKLSEAEFVRQSKKQSDYYNIDVSDIRLSGMDISKFLNESIVHVKEANMKLDLNVMNDRMLPINTDSKVGKYPQQLLLKLKIPVFIKKAVITNSKISYRERAKASEQIGNVEFNHVNATIHNITNIPELIRQNPVCSIDASGLVLNKGKATTHWKLMLNTSEGAFSLSGKIGAMKLSTLNSIAMPLGMTSVSGDLKNFTFDITGNDYKAQGSLSFLYNDLKMASFKMDETGDTMKNKKLETLFGNALIINNNPSKGKLRNANFSLDREHNKSFFNLIWKNIFDGIQKTTFSKGGAELQKQLKRPKIRN